MKPTLLTVGAALVLLPLFPTQSHANPHRVSGAVEPTVLLRCRETRSSDRSFYESEHIESHTFSSHESSSHSTAEQHTNRSSQIREILRRHETGHTTTTPVVIEIQGDCDAIRVEIGAEHLPDELFPGEFDRLGSYEEWHERLHDQHGELLEDLSPWLTRPGSGWNWLLRRRGSILNTPQPNDSWPNRSQRDGVNEDVAQEDVAQSAHCMCIQAPCNCASYFSP